MNLIKEMEQAMNDHNKEKIKSLIIKHDVSEFYDCTLLHYMVNKNDFPGVRFLIEQGWDINHLDFLGQNALSYMRFADKELLSYLIEKGIDINKICHSGDTLMLDMVELGIPENVKWVFRNGGDPNIEDSCGNTVFDYMGEAMIRHMIPVFLEQPERLNEKNLRFLKAKKLECLYD